MKRKNIFLLLVTLLSVLALTCKDPTPLSLDNPYDPEYAGGNPIPNAPTNLAITSNSSGSIRLNWQDNSSFEKGFRIERAVNNGSFMEIGRVGANVITLLDNTLDTSHTYRYRVCAYTANNSSQFSPVLKIVFFRADSLIHTYTGIGAAYSVAFTRDGQTIAARTYWGLYTLKTSNENSKVTFDALGQNLSSFEISPDGMSVGCISSGAIILWHINDGTFYRWIRQYNQFSSFTFSPDGRLIAAANAADSTVHLIQVSDTALLRAIKPGRLSELLAFSPDGQLIATASTEDSLIRLWRVNDGSLYSTLHDGPYGHISITFSPDGQTIAGGGNTGVSLSFWQVTGGTPFRTLNVPYGPDVFDPHWQMIASFIPYGEYGMSNQIGIFRVSDGALIQTIGAIHVVNYLNSLAFSPDGTILASCTDDGIQLWALVHQWAVVQ